MSAAQRRHQLRLRHGGERGVGDEIPAHGQGVGQVGEHPLGVIGRFHLDAVEFGFGDVAVIGQTEDAGVGGDHVLDAIVEHRGLERTGVAAAEQVSARQGEAAFHRVRPFLQEVKAGGLDGARGVELVDGRKPFGMGNRAEDAQIVAEGVKCGELGREGRIRASGHPRGSCIDVVEIPANAGDQGQPVVPDELVLNEQSEFVLGPLGVRGDGDVANRREVDEAVLRARLEADRGVVLEAVADPFHRVVTGQLPGAVLVVGVGEGARRGGVGERTTRHPTVIALHVHRVGIAQRQVDIEPGIVGGRIGPLNDCGVVDDVAVDIAEGVARHDAGLRVAALVRLAVEALVGSGQGLLVSVAKVRGALDQPREAVERRAGQRSAVCLGHFVGAAPVAGGQHFEGVVELLSEHRRGQGARAIAVEGLLEPERAGIALVDEVGGVLGGEVDDAADGPCPVESG